MRGIGLGCCLLAVAAACGAENKAPSAPLDRIRLPVGIAVHHGDLLVLSSNADLTNDEATGGSLIALASDPVPVATAAVTGALRVRSFGGDLAVARADVPGARVPYAEACGVAADLPAAQALTTPLALFGTRGSNTLNAVAIRPDRSLSCSAAGARCEVSPGAGFGDPLPVAVACGGGRARAFYGFLTTPNGEALIGELDLHGFGFRSAVIGSGVVRGLAYDRDRDRLFVAGLATGSATPLRWLDLAGCTVGAAPGDGGCLVGAAFLPPVATPWGIELRALALAPPAVPGVPRARGEPLRAYATGRLYDASAAASVGYRSTDFGGVLLVLELEDDALGGVSPRVVSLIEIPRGAQAIQVLPRASGWAAGRRDVVAALSVTEGALTIYDDETGAMATFRTDELSTPGHPATGAPILGAEPYGLAADPETDGTTARLWVASYRESFVTPIDVTLEPELSATFAGAGQMKIAGPTP